MYSQDSSIRDILDNYLRAERELEMKIKERRRYKSRNVSDNLCESFSTDKRFKRTLGDNGDTCNLEINNSATIFGRIDSAESRVRNQEFIKSTCLNLQDLEEAKARLRTIASFTPTDQELRVLVGAYRGLLGNVAQTQS
ncbi:uncharacterized protein LOC124304374 isoform X1 [Neodiprion virginianus]|uniref:uncharacterized protein LOC124304374 isoform X1 n=1 Tax=Neodiprion virginianus TaxID=2961670 RepID=UPI001EE740B4|nr:uncharacterized protein LOC124304374 isoform X1 [Neodiprion virginianus]